MKVTVTGDADAGAGVTAPPTLNGSPSKTGLAGQMEVIAEVVRLVRAIFPVRFEVRGFSVGLRV